MSLTTTTLSEAITASDVVIVLASTTGVTVGKMLGFDSEIALVTDVVGNNTRKVRVQRGVDGTAAASHAAASTVYVGSPDDFANAAPNVPIVAPSGTFAVGAGPGANPSFQEAPDASFGSVDATGYSVNGNAGAAGGTFTSITSITVENGLITAISGT